MVAKITVMRNHRKVRDFTVYGLPANSVCWLNFVNLAKTDLRGENWMISHHSCLTNDSVYVERMPMIIMYISRGV